MTEKKGLTRVVKIITLINVIAFILAYSQDYAFYDTYALWACTELERPFQYITHMFLHANLAHIILNMLVFLSFGTMVEEYFGEKKFIIFYLLSGLGAAFFYILTGHQGPMVGASGAIFGVIAAAAIIKPNLIVYLFFLIPVKAKWIVPLIVLFEIYSGLTAGPDNHVAHFAHVGGAITGGLFLIGNRLIKNK